LVPATSQITYSKAISSTSIRFEWSGVPGADKYLLVVDGDDGHTHTCSSNSTDCSFTDLHCAETYAVTVLTMDRGCYSDPSPDVELRTVFGNMPWFMPCSL
uniref:Fibronectin type-III domain-containing protein n=1 Tax=Oncorhynchus tshawytscha TaxID=74940 RepID=A0A8C8FD89_ONCTS